MSESETKPAIEFLNSSEILNKLESKTMRVKDEYLKKRKELKGLLSLIEKNEEMEFEIEEARTRIYAMLLDQMRLAEVGNDQEYMSRLEREIEALEPVKPKAEEKTGK